MSTSFMEEILAAAGKAGQLIQSIDWTTTPIGSIQDWPQSLCTAVSICLSCPSPLLIWWGPELVMLYNDSCRPILGAAKHPRAMGARGADVWPEIWDVIGPMLKGVLERGEAASVKELRLPFYRNGDAENFAFTCSSSPIHGESGEVCGVFTLLTKISQPTPLPVHFPDLAHVAVSARTLSPTSTAGFCADWYDVLALPDNRILLAVGDVIARGVQAASTVSELCNALRAYAWQGMGPAGTLKQLNRLAMGLGEQYISTLLCLEFHARNGRLVYAAAGHPPPLLLRSDGNVTYLDGGQEGPIGMAPDLRCTETEERLVPGDTLLLYTDGLVASSTRTVDEGLARLGAAMASAPADLDELVDHVVGTVQHKARDDDVAVLAFRVIDRPVFTLERRMQLGLVGLHGMRRELRAFLRSAGLREDDMDELILAVNEAAANAIEHPQKRTEPFVDVKVEVRHDEVVACVRDFGQWDDTDPEPDRGRGLILMRALGEVEIRRHVEGTRLTLRRALQDR
jgi:anti-sigma regulatory factor (Ser/Thr protein kinase)